MEFVRLCAAWGVSNTCMLLCIGLTSDIEFFSTIRQSTSLSNSSRGAPKEDEVYSVARLLGDLVAYRASGTGHLELLAGLFSPHAVACCLLSCWYSIISIII
jgi:hypothetical protein